MKVLVMKPGVQRVRMMQLHQPYKLDPLRKDTALSQGKIFNCFVEQKILGRKKEEETVLCFAEVSLQYSFGMASRRLYKMPEKQWWMHESLSDGIEKVVQVHPEVHIVYFPSSPAAFSDISRDIDKFVVPLMGSLSHMFRKGLDNIFLFLFREDLQRALAEQLVHCDLGRILQAFSEAWL
mmetsp:Transcript_20519/g.50355  ORF Transcript_20519/g.50355 Transcript_20519/m.50355 type:complete len:180 (-) Transcript_20519:3496-4035(-)